MPEQPRRDRQRPCRGDVRTTLISKHATRGTEQSRALDRAISLLRPAISGECTAPAPPRARRQPHPRRDYREYAQALGDAVPGVSLAGPETAGSGSEWLHGLTRLGPLIPRSLTVHRYPLSLCWARSSPFYPRISSLLSERSSAVLAARLRGAIVFAHNAGVSLRVSEMNSVSCGGNEGVADSFATALWAPDALFELVAP